MRTISFKVGTPALVGERWETSHWFQSRSQMVDLYRQAYPNDTNNVVGNKAGQVHRFLLQIEAGDYVITPRSNSELIYGRVLDESYYFSINNPDGCYYEHRRKVDWATRRLRRSEFSESFQSSIRGQLTVFRVRQCDEFLRVIGDQHAPPIPAPSTDPYRLVLDRLIELDPGEFEFLIGHLMAVMGFADPIVTPLSNDHGIDVRGELDLQGLASVKLVVQVKRYKRTNTIATGAIRQFRADIPMDYQGAFITTSSYQTKARDEAERRRLQANIPCGRTPIGRSSQYALGGADKSMESQLGWFQ